MLRADQTVRKSIKKVLMLWLLSRGAFTSVLKRVLLRNSYENEFDLHEMKVQMKHILAEWSAVSFLLGG